jgi:FdhD protein
VNAHPVPPGAVPAQVSVQRPGAAAEQPDWLADEVPVALVVDGVSQAVMLATPADLEDFALGFALTEGWIARADELYAVEPRQASAGIELQLELAASRRWALRERRRALAGRTGCGLCGVDSLAQVERPLAPVMAPALRPGALARAMHGLAQRQPLNALTGATHAAAWCALDGGVQLVREDIGRHNALDKLVGAMARSGVDARDGFVAITSRASFEMVHKAASVGVGLVAAVSAPTARAVRTAKGCGLALAGFVRGDEAVFYTGPGAPAQPCREAA